jgi:hypothetical protein
MPEHYSVTGDKSPHQRIEPLSYSIAECVEMGLGSRASIYCKIHEGVLTAFKDGTRTRITADSVKCHHADLVSRSKGLGPPVCRGDIKKAADTAAVLGAKAIAGGAAPSDIGEGR